MTVTKGRPSLTRSYLGSYVSRAVQLLTGYVVAGLVPIQNMLVSSGHLLWFDNYVGFSLQANYTDRPTATCWRNLVPIFTDRGVSRGQRGGSPTVVNLRSLDQSRYSSFK
jgi:hypothetical protein